MGTETTKVVLDLDNEEFMSKLKESLGLVGKIGAGENLDGLKEALAEVGTVVAVVGVAFVAMKAAIDFTEAAEKVHQISTTFEMLASSAGIAADVIKEDLVAAAAGMAGSTEILQAANRAMVVLGENSAKLPAIMELSRKVVAVMGGDLTSTFEGMSRAMALGNARMLRQYGLTVSVDEATKKFAASTGIGVEFLSDAGKKQAIFNAAMEQASEKFKDVDLNATPVTNNMARMGTAFTEMKEKLVDAFASAASPLIQFLTGPASLRAMITTIGFAADAVGIFVAGFKTLILGVAAAGDVINGAVNSFSKFGQGIWAVVTSNEALKKSLNESNEKLGTINFSTTQKAYESLVSTVTSKPIFKELLADLDKAEQKAKEAAKVGGSTDGGEASGDKNKFANQEKEKKAQQKFERDILQLHAERLKDEENLETTAVGFHKIREEQNIQAALKASSDMKKLDQDRKGNRLISESQYADGVKQIQEKLELDLKKIRLKAQEDELQALKNLEKQNEYTAKGFSTSWKRNSMQATMDLKNFSKLGDQSFHSVGQNAAAAFQAMGDGSKSAGDAMKGFLFGTIGDVAIAQGTMHLLAGIWPPNPIELAEGAALIALGGALKSVGSSSGASAPSASSVSGSGPGGDASASATGGAPAPAAAPHKSVSINIQGSLFETDQTRQRLMSMIREAGDFTDFNLKQVGQP